MKTITMEQIYIEIPSVEVAFLRTLVNKMGCSLKRKKKTAFNRLWRMSTRVISMKPKV